MHKPTFASRNDAAPGNFTRRVGGSRCCTAWIWSVTALFVAVSLLTGCNKQEAEKPSVPVPAPDQPAPDLSAAQPALDDLKDNIEERIRAGGDQGGGILVRRYRLESAEIDQAALKRGVVRAKVVVLETVRNRNPRQSGINADGTLRPFNDEENEWSSIQGTARWEFGNFAPQAGRYCPVRDQPDIYATLRTAGYKWENDQWQNESAPAPFPFRADADPKDATAYHLRGRARYENAQYDAALKDYARALKLDPKLAPAHFDRGRAWLKKNDYDKAIEDFTTAISFDPTNALAHSSRGLALYSKSQYDAAIKDFTAALELDPKSALAYLGRALALVGQKHYDQAIEDYTMVIKLEGKHASAFRLRGDAWLLKKDTDKAIEDFNAALAIDPKDAGAYRLRGDAWLDKKDYGKAIENYTSALALDSKDAGAYLNRGIAWEGKKDYKKAVADYSEASVLAPGSWEAFVGLAWIRATCPEAGFRDGKKAVELASKALKLSETSNGHDTLAAAYAETGDFERAIAEQRQALEDMMLDKEERKKRKARLELYRAKKPYRDE